MLQGFWFNGGSVEELAGLGKILDGPSPKSGETTMGACFAEALLWVRDRRGKQVRLTPNRAQLTPMNSRRGQSNIVLKARQMGISTWVAGRFFLKTITQPGTLTVQVAHTQAAADGRILSLRPPLSAAVASGMAHRGAADRGRRAARQIVSSGAGQRVHRGGNRRRPKRGTRSDDPDTRTAPRWSRWPGGAQETLAGLRAALPATGELVLESTPNGADGCFFRGGRVSTNQCRSRESLVGHFFPWWWEPEYNQLQEAVEADWTDEERGTGQAKHGLTGRQIGFRRRTEADFADWPARNMPRTRTPHVFYSCAPVSSI